MNSASKGNPGPSQMTEKKKFSFEFEKKIHLTIFKGHFQNSHRFKSYLGFTET